MTSTLDWLVIAAGWIAGWILLWRAPRLQRGAGGRARSVSVVVPVRNEAGTLPTLLRSLAVQTWRGFEVHVVDDGSKDGTADKARELGFVRVVTATPVPPGWTGKAWACQLGAEAASGEVLIFLDADVELAPDAIDRLLAAHREHGGLVSVQPHHRVEGLLEQASAFFNLVAFMGAGFGGVLSGRATAAFGPCLVTSRSDYLQVGGHARVRGDVVEDLGLGRAFAAEGLPVTGFVGGRTVTYRMYPGAGWPLVEGWSKNVALGALRTEPLRALSIALWVTALLLVPIQLLEAPALPLATAYAACALQLATQLRTLGSFGALVSALYPIALVTFVAIFARSAYLTFVRRSVTWRGRTLSVGGT